MQLLEGAEPEMELMTERLGLGGKTTVYFASPLTVREDTIGELFHPKLVSEPISHECTTSLTRARVGTSEFQR
jgi:hypothetical protein